MPELVTPDGKPVAAAPVAAPKIDPDETNREFSRAMAADDPSASQPPPRRDEKAEQPKRTTRGRPRKDEKSRTDKAPQPPQKVDTDYTEALAGLTTMGWAVLAGIPVTEPYAAVVDANQVQLVGALNAAAQNNAQIREQIEKLANGGGGVWAIQLAAVGTNMALQTMQIVKDPSLREEARQATRSKFRAFLKAQGVNVEDPEQEAADGQPAAA